MDVLLFARALGIGRLPVGPSRYQAWLVLKAEERLSLNLLGPVKVLSNSNGLQKSYYGTMRPYDEIMNALQVTSCNDSHRESYK